MVFFSSFPWRGEKRKPLALAGVSPHKNEQGKISLYRDGLFLSSSFFWFLPFFSFFSFFPSFTLMINAWLAVERPDPCRMNCFLVTKRRSATACARCLDDFSGSHTHTHTHAHIPATPLDRISSSPRRNGFGSTPGWSVALLILRPAGLCGCQRVVKRLYQVKWPSFGIDSVFSVRA